MIEKLINSLKSIKMGDYIWASILVSAVIFLGIIITYPKIIIIIFIAIISIICVAKIKSNIKN